MHLCTYVGVNNLRSVTVRATVITVMWNAVSPSGCGPVLYIVTAVSLMWPTNIITIATSNNVATISVLRNCTSYNISVAAVNRAGTGSSSMINVTTSGCSRGKYKHLYECFTSKATYVCYKH